MATLTPLRLLFFAVFMCYLLQLAKVSAIPTVGFTSASSNESETSGSITISLERTVQTNILTTVTIDLSGTSTKDSDYVVSGSLVVTFPANDTTNKNITIFITNDQVVEAVSLETIILTIRADAAFTTKAGLSSHTVYIADDDVNINCQKTQVTESTGSANITITRSGSSQALSANHSIGCFTKDDTALAPSDYTTINSSSSFTSGSDVKKMSITIKDDDVPEGNETLKVKCYTNDVRVQIQSSCKDAVVTIQNDDSYAFFCPGGYAGSVVENDGSYSVDICRVGVLSSTPTVQLCRTTDGGSAPSITAGCENVTFPANMDKISATITINDDDVGENEDKTFQIYLQSFGSPVKINDTTKVITLKDNDNTFYLTDVTEMKMIEGFAPNNVTVTIKREGEISVSANVSLNLIFTATAESVDCTGSTPRVIQFNAGVTSRTITACTVVDDRLVEDDETFNVTISGVGSSNVRAVKSERIIKLISNEVKVTCQGASLEEDNGPAIVKLDRTGGTSVLSNPIQCSTADGTASSPTDYQSQTSATVSFAQNDRTKEFPVVLTNDSVVEGNETLTVTCTISNPRVVIDPSCTGIKINIINDDTYVYFCPGYSTSIEENVGSYTVRLCRVGVLEDTHTVRICRTSDSVSLPHDYPAVQARCDDIVFTAYDEVKELVIPVTNDAWGEQEYKTFNISMNTTDDGVTFNDTTSYVVTIHDDDNTIYMTDVSLLEMTEGVGSPNVTLTINRVGRTLVASNVNLELKFAATAESADCIGASPRVIQFDAGVTSKTITACKVVDDRLVEDDETFNVTISGVGSSNVRTGKSERTIKLISDDVNVTCQGTSLKEANGPAIVRLDRTGATAITANDILCSTANGTAFSSIDYESQTSATVSYAINQLTNNFSVVITNDRVVEANESFTVTCNTSDPRVVVDPSCTGIKINIINDDNTFYLTDVTELRMTEGVGSQNVTLTINRVGRISVASNVNLELKFTATAESADCIGASPRVIQFNSGVTSRTITACTVVDDRLVEDDETFNVTISGVGTSTVRTGKSKRTIKLISDDVNIFCRNRRGHQSVYENKGPVLMEFTREGSLQYNHTMRIRTIDGSAKSGEDYTAIDKTLTFAPNQININETVLLVNDNVLESDETFRLSVTSTDDRVHMICPGTDFTILNDDTFIRCPNQNIEVSEGKKTVYFTLKREGVLNKASPIWFSTKDDTAFDKSDYKPQSKVNKTFLPGQVYMTLSVDLVDDEYKEDDETFSVIIGSYVPTTLTSGDKCTLITIKDNDPMVVNQQTATNVTVNEGEDIMINCSNSAQGEGQWKNEDGTDINLSSRIKIEDNNVLVFRNSSKDDAGVYKCLRGKSVHLVNLRVKVTVKVKISLRILNWNFTNEIQDKSSGDYRRFEENFKKQMDIVYQKIEGYQGVEILELRNGSIRVVFRVIVVQVINNKGERTTFRRVVVAQKIVDEAKTGWINKNLQVDTSPDAFETDAPPPQPENVTLVEATDDGAEISWDKPINHEYYGIKGYFIEYWVFGTSNIENTGVFKGQRTKITGLKDDTSYTARVVGKNKERGQESDNIDIKTKKAVLAGWIIALIVIFCILFLVLIIALIIFLCRRRKMQNERERQEMFAMSQVKQEKVELERGQPQLKSYTNKTYMTDGHWTEFPRENLVLQDELGSGEFGVVHKGQLLQDGYTTECAVKTLKAAAGPEEHRALYEELEIMANVGNHPNLVNLIGATAEEDKLFVIVEFARHGSLIEYLRSQRLKPEEEYEFDLKYVNRLRIALDVAKGMAFLQRKRCVHRDLAARNVLLADDFVAKVADFGLSRDIYETGEYEKTTTGKMPTRWMAIESLELRRFTLKSDVWSFGVLLWEIETKGLMPHGAVSYIELLDQLKRGYRLEQPKGTPDELYELMQNCWEANPINRPDFPDVRDTLETLLSGAPEYLEENPYRA